MNILCSIHLYPPYNNCGSEYYLHNILKYLISKDHHCRVFLHKSKNNNILMPYIYEGVEVFSGREITQQDSYRWADLIITHLDYTQFTIDMANKVKRPVVHLIHSDTVYQGLVSAKKNNNIVYNSQWLADKLNYNLPSIVFNPAVDYDYYNVNENPVENEYITMINLDMNKGGHLFKEIALRMPEKKFLGVLGSYSEPADEGQITDQPDNVKVISNTNDILSIYKQTRILLMLSLYESWGMTATEAMCNGIPVICTPTPGLLENCKEAGIFVPKRKIQDINNSPYDVAPVIKALYKLDNKVWYNEVSQRCRKRAIELKPDKHLTELEQFLINASET